MFTYIWHILSIILQVIPIILALRIIRLAQSRIAWVLISISFALMTIRRLSEFLLYLQNPDQYGVQDYNSLIDIIVSVIMIISLVSLTRILKSVKKTEAERAESEIRFRTLFSNSSDELFLADLEGKFLEVNKEVTKKLGYSRKELLQMNFTDIKPAKYVNKVKENIDTIIKQGTHIYESEHISKDKKTLFLEMSSRIIRYKGKKVIFTIARDITERKEFERKILSAVIDAEERERKRFAKEIHDGLGPLLYTIKIYLNEIYSEDISAEEKENLIKFTNELLDDAVSNIRTISDNLMPTVITDYGLVKAIESLVKKINISDKIKISFTCKNCTSKLDINVEMVLFRITEELINNTLKHSSASNAEITIDIAQSRLILEYSDNGVGCIVNDELLNSKNGMGLKNIISRSKTVNANYSFSNKTPGFHFTLEMDLK
jgi:PAS domain S-box-containing protein